MFQVIQLENGDNEVVPKSWIKENKVLWSNIARTYAEKNYNPRRTWKLEKCVTCFDNACFDTYEKALEKCKILKEITDSSHQSVDSSMVHSRCKTKKQESDFEYYADNYQSSYDEDTNDELPLDDLPSMSEEENDETLTDTTAGIQPDTVTELNNPQFNGVEKATVAMSNPDGSLDITDLLPSLCKCSDVKDELKNAFNREISELRKDIKEIKAALMENSNRIETFMFQSKREWEVLKINIQNININPKFSQNDMDKELESIFQEVLPLSCIENLKVLNDLLLEEKRENYFVKKIRQIGGKDAKSTLMNIIKTCFTMEFQRMCNWSGANKKIKLQGSKVIEIIIKFMLENFHLTKIDIEGHLKYIFQHSYDRFKLETKQRNQSTIVHERT
ncbi:unnamed protein product [Brassicogethes aeneus]|uniref:DUF4806 domain-containing protein n=1 Tax=Brassicogethes aeneus TaxID=1431903 RepID=A0A9P0AWB4_BRAAE|nr:unnamed protein product [Brassicogethes aeneus]